MYVEPSSYYINQLSDKFSDFQVLPYVYPLEPGTKSLLYKRSVFGKKLVTTLAKHLRLSALLNELIGIDIFSANNQSKGILESIVETLLKDTEEMKSLRKVSLKAVKRLDRKGNFYRGISYGIPLQRLVSTPLLVKEKPADGTTVLVEGMLNRVEKVAEYYPDIVSMIEGEDISWVLCDRPYFLMSAHFEDYDHAIVPLKIDDTLIKLMDEHPAFGKELGWYPYVRVMGTFYDCLSPKTTGIPRIDFGMLFWRQPPQHGVIETGNMNIHFSRVLPSIIEWESKYKYESNLFEAISELTLTYVIYRALKKDRCSDETLRTAVLGFCDKCLHFLEEAANDGRATPEKKIIGEIRQFFDRIST